MDLKSAVQGFILDCEARRLSENTMDGYAFVLNLFMDWIGHDTMIATISTKDIKLFLNSFPLVKAKTVLNYHTCLSSLWTFMVNEKITDDHIIQKVRPPKPDKVQVQPFTEMEVKVLFASIEKSRPYKRLTNTHITTHSTPDAKKVRAMMAILLDTGMRSSELANLKIEDVNLRDKEIRIYLGKGRKSRTVYFEAKTAKVIWQYLKEYRDRVSPKEPLFLTQAGNPMVNDNVNKIINRVGKRAGVNPCNPHRFRHTFAIFYLRNGGDVITLQKLLGHESRDMTNRYLALSQADFGRAHRIASPVENLNLGF